MLHKRTPSSNLLINIKKIRNEINLFYTQEIEKKMTFVKQKYYESGPRSAKILARRLQKQRADNTIYKIKDPASNILQYKPEDWIFLHKALEQFGLHSDFIGVIRTLYNKPTAQIKINGSLSNTITLWRGTRQGCPISPISLLFALYIEPLAQWLRQTENIRGISINGEDHRVALYADDILIYLTDPSKTFLELMTLLQKFGNYSGYKLNVQKTQLLAYNYSPPKLLRDKFQVNWDQRSLKYLGIHLPNDVSRLKEINYYPLLEKIKEDINRRNISFLSLSHRIECVKMNILPRYLFLFQALPVEIPLKEFSEIDKIISRFIWQGKKPRVRFKTLQLSKAEGGMGLPYFKGYYYAAQIRPLFSLCSPQFYARWKDIELSIMKDPPVHAALAYTHLDKLIKDIQNPWIKTQLKIWNKVKGEYQLDDKIQIIQWCAFDPGFRPNLLDNRFKIWISKGVTTFYSLTEKGKFREFEDFKKEYHAKEHLSGRGKNRFS
uniref:Reverse transcriptase domain-containing protein n=1 Tax=Pygocentrus nattereri TaxID=42514 RepID=A0AAR2JJM9_PYGNA